MSLKLRMIQAYYAQQQEANFPDLLGLSRLPIVGAIEARMRIRRPDAVVLGPVLIAFTVLLWLPGLADFNLSLWLFTGLGFLLSFLGLRYPVAGLFGLGILMAVDPVTRLYLNEVGFYRFNTLSYWLMIVAALNIPSLLRLNDSHTRFLEALTLLMAFEVFISTDLMRGVQHVLNIAITFGMIVYISRSLREPFAFYWLGVILGVFSGLGGLIYNIQIDTLPPLNPNSWAFFPAASLIAISLGLFQAKGSFRRILILLVLFGVNFSWIFLSGSRGNMLTGLICFLFILWHIRKMSWTPLVMVAAVLVAYWLSLQMQDQLLYAISKIDKTFNTETSIARRTSGRSTIVEGGLKIFRSNVLGTGTGSFRDRYAEVSGYRAERPSHTAWISVLVDNGVPGFLLLAAYLASFTWMGWRKRREGLLMLGLLVTATVSTVFISKEFGSKAVWFLTAAGAALLNEEETFRAFRANDPLKVLRSFTHMKKYWDVPDEQRSAAPVLPAGGIAASTARQPGD